LGWNIQKVKHLTCSNWTSPTLSPAQKQYAAFDAVLAGLIGYRANQDIILE
jgi:ribonuclease D